MDLTNALFGSGPSLLRTLLVGVLAYAAMVFLLRVSGRRTLSKMNAFDFIVTVALGSSLATVLLSKSVSLADGVVAFGTLIGLQYLITWSSVRLKWFRQLVTGEPIMLFHRGRFLPQAMRRARVTEAEVRSAMRSAGIARLEGVETVVLETDGSFSAVASSEGEGHASWDDVPEPDRSDER